MNMNEIVYVIPGNPIALSRPRLSHCGIYDSQRNEKLIAGLNLRQQHGALPLYTSTPLHLEATFYMNMPKSSRRKWPQLRGTYHFYKADLDNLLKFLLDICNNVILKDDSIVSSISACKIYDDNPRTEFTFRVLK